MADCIMADCIMADCIMADYIMADCIMADCKLGDARQSMDGVAWHLSHHPLKARCTHHQAMRT
jgi:hypothetical protein